jgi:DNA-binding LacI/PurR family transcriptional regulator/AraC-like DNA-binding protein
MAIEKKKIGLLLASIHTGISRSVWTSFVRTAADENISLFIFPGGRLNARQDFENLRNPVYYLANEENLDGCISWSSSIQYAQSQQDIELLHSSFGTLPFVTLGLKSQGHPCVEFDAYNGMKTLVSHCVNIHGARKIAFLRGPDFHQSAQARFDGYCDALKEAGLIVGKGAALQSPLVTDPFDWEAGEAAAIQLFQERGLTPGRDFDTLIGSSDLMVLGAINYFAKHGFFIPANYHAAGFNNSAESCAANSMLSTVNLPYTQMCKEAFKKLLGAMSKKKRKQDEDIILNCGVILRESCGCTLNLETTNINEILEKITGGNLELKSNIDNNSVQSIINIFKKREQQNANTRRETESWNTVLNSLKCDLLGTRDRFSLVQNLARHLPKIGINTIAIVLYGNEKTSIFAGGFSIEGISTLRDQRFSSRLLVPSSLKTLYNDGIFMVQPLFIDNRSLGYFVHNVPINDGIIFEELRSAVSYALKGVFLLEETVQAKRIAEQAERAKTEFLRSLENGLFNPLQGIKEKLEAIEKKAANAKINSLLDDLKDIKTFVFSKEAEAASLMDFTLAKVDELSLRKTIFDPEELLPKIGTFPLLAGDTTRLAQCFSLMLEQYEDYSAKLTYEGFSVTFQKAANHKIKSEKTNSAEKAWHFNLLLVERIILLHGGVFSPDKDYCTITLPWPTLTGCELSKNPVGAQDHVLVISDSETLPDNFFPLPQIRDIAKSQPGKIAFIVWNAAGANSGDLVKVASLKNKSEYTGIPFLCYSLPSGAEGYLNSAASLIDTVEFALKSSKKETLLFIGSQDYWSGYSEQLMTPLSAAKERKLEKIHIDSMAAFNETVGEINLSMIVFNSLDVEGVAAVRRHPLTVMIPILIISDKIDNAEDVAALSQYSRLIICHRAAVSSAEFRARIQAVIGGAEILPPHTGVLVKKAILYFGQRAESHISRWKLADSVNVSEDYLTRIFHREMGLSLWDYLSRLRIFLAAELLRRTDDTIQDIASRTGFQDHAYFCRVFKKIYGVPPGQMRK